jgi:hypothetical protein
MRRMKFLRAFMGVSLAAVAILAQPGTASAIPVVTAAVPQEACPVGHIIVDVSYYCTAEFTLRGSNGYRIAVSSENVGQGPSTIELSAQRRNEDIVYEAHGTVTPTSMRASFGRLGRVSLRFRPSGKTRQVKVAKRCHADRPPVVKAKLGTFVGTVRFQGERGYTKVSAHRATGGIGDPLAIRSEGPDCETSRSKAKKMQELESVALSASDPTAAIGFTVARAFGQLSRLGPPTALSPQGRYLFLLFAAERAEQMSILRSVAAVGSAGDFLFDNALTSATVSPPAPFTGTGGFQRNSDGSTDWTGTLSVPVAGLGMVRLTEPGFRAELATVAALLK